MRSVLVLLLAACDEEPTSIPSTLPLTVSVETAGAAFDANGYTIEIPGLARPLNMEIVGTFHFSLPETDPLTLRLGDVADNCSVDGGETRTLRTPLDGPVTFRVHCAAPEELASARILFVRGLDHGYDLYMLDLDGSQARAVTSNGRSIDPAVSRDGQIAFARGEAADFWPSTIHVLNLENATASPVTVGGPHLQPSWSPDGSQLVYTAGDGYWSGSIRRKAVSGGEELVLSRGETGAGEQWTADGEPAWSPDGTRIALHSWSTDEEQTGIFVVNPDGTGWTRVAPAGYNPVWSPTSAEIAFQDRLHLRIVRADGSGQSRSSVLTGRSAGPSDWSTDGRWIALTIGEQRPDIYLLDPQDGRMLRITIDERSSSAVFWD